MLLHEDAGDKKLFPCLAQGSSYWSQDTEDSRDEYRPATTKIVVARVTDPAAYERASDVGAGVNKSNKQVVVPAIRATFRVTFADAKFYRKGQIRPIRSSLVPDPL